MAASDPRKADHHLVRSALSPCDAGGHQPEDLRGTGADEGGVAAMAIRLSKAFGSTPETWVRMQAAYDLAAALREESKIRVERYRPPAGV